MWPGNLRVGLSMGLPRPGKLKTLRFRAQQKGFNLIEVLFAIGVVAVGLLGLASVFISGMRANTFGKHTAEATTHARQVLEVIRSRGLAFKSGTLPPNAASGFNDGTNKVALNATPPLQMAMMPANTPYRRSITTVRSSNDVNSHLYNFLDMTVTIYWEERGILRNVSITSRLKGESS